MASKLGALLKSMSSAMPDVILLSGICFLIYGISRVSHTAAYIAGGLAGVILGLAGGRK